MTEKKANEIFSKMALLGWFGILNPNEVMLDGCFTVEELKALIWRMEND